MKHKTQNTLYNTAQSPQCTRVIRRGASGVEHKFYKNTLDENNTLHKCVINESGRTHSKTLETLDENTSLKTRVNIDSKTHLMILHYGFMIFKTETKTHLLFMIHELSWMHWEERCKKAFMGGLGLEWELQ